MRKVFAQAANVKAFVGAMSRLQNRPPDLPGMALVYGEPGLGKTRTCLWWSALDHNNGVFVRTLKLMTGRWLLAAIVAELGEAPMHRSEDLFRQAVDTLLEKPRVLFMDEADYLARDSRVLETLRDLHDTTGSPIVLIGEEMADKKLARYKHFYDRFSEIVRFSMLSQQDVKAIADQMCEVKLTDDAVAYIHGHANRFRRVVIWLYKVEALARANSLKEISAAHLGKVKV